jgi:hypothetical protein
MRAIVAGIVEQYGVAHAYGLYNGAHATEREPIYVTWGLYWRVTTQVHNIMIRYYKCRAAERGVDDDQHLSAPSWRSAASSQRTLNNFTTQSERRWLPIRRCVGVCAWHASTYNRRHNG